MTRVEKGKYSALIRGDYLAKLPSDRDKSIQASILHFLELPSAQRKEATDKQRVHIIFPAEVPPDYLMWLQHIKVPDELVKELEGSVKYNDLDRILNAAIKLWLRDKGEQIVD
ncbi:hypothetical protein [Desulfomonile tiedjei]|uniref:Uncharacterized protein n=1 Tax=Desulfomonile tiedjei (strain ATCC 49306 / DSM 6799 / DCB-1) TaxID=706587 RepID=I4CB72_DESTA|nr:hypothetical protein [Desulfomonile tiedjei]AFM26813.1 hypothetical protein Desti_4176 [Desulfomonile tiedjei DSM 6799]